MLCGHVKELGGSNNGAAFASKSAVIILEELLIQDSSSPSVSFTISKWGLDIVGAGLKSLCPVLLTSSSSRMQLPLS